MICFQLWLLILGLLVPAIGAQESPGKQFLWQNDVSDTLNPDDSVFTKHNDGTLDEDRFKSLVSRIKIEVVAPNKQLRDMMRLVSTKSQASFLQDYDRFYGKLQVGSSSRPMLLSYLGLDLAEPNVIQSWCEKQMSLYKQSISRSCKTLLDDHTKRLDKAGVEADIRGLISPMSRESKRYVAFLLQRSNLNLFMLENYLLLCNKLVPEEMSTKERFSVIS